MGLLRRLALKNLQHISASSTASNLLSRNVASVGPPEKQVWGSQLLQRLYSAAEEKPDAGRSVEVADGGRKSPRRRGRRGLWRRNNRDFVPAIWATKNINPLVENLTSSSHLRENDSYKIIVEDRVLSVRGEHKEEKEVKDDEYWSKTNNYGYYDTSLVLPDDAKVDGIKAEMKDGVLSIVIRKAERPKKDVKEVQVQ